MEEQNYISTDKMQTIFDSAPKSLNREKIVNELVGRGFKIEGLNYRKPQELPKMPTQQEIGRQQTTDTATGMVDAAKKSLVDPITSRLGEVINRPGQDYSTPTAALKTTLSTGLQGASAAVSGVTDVAAGLVKEGAGTLTGGYSDKALTALGNALGEKVGEVINAIPEEKRASFSQFIDQHPELAANTGSLANLALTFAGSGVLGKASTAAGRLPGSTAFESAVATAKKAPGAVATDIKQTVVGNPEARKIIAMEKDASKAAKQATVAKNSALEAMSQKFSNLSVGEKEALTRKGLLSNKVGKLEDEVMINPSEELNRAVDIMSNPEMVDQSLLVSAKDTPSTTYSKISKVVSTYGKDAENYLKSDPRPIDVLEDKQMVEDLYQKATKKFGDNGGAVNEYSNQLGIFAKHLDDFTGGDPSKYTTDNYYLALKAYEKATADTIPKGIQAIIDSAGASSGKVAAAADIRKHVRDVISQKHPEFKDQMYDLMALYDAEEIALQNAAKFKPKSFSQKYPKTTATAKYGAAAAVGGGLINAITK